MAVKIRLARYGKNKQPFYRVVVTEGASRRDGRFIELIGTINPRTNPPEVTLDEERVKYWVSMGAHPSERVASVIEDRIPGYLKAIEKRRLDKLQAQRASRKKRAASRATA